MLTEKALMGLEDKTLTTLRSAPGKRLASSHTADIIVILKIHVQTTSIPGGTGRAICSTPPSWPPGYHIKIAITVSIPESRHPRYLPLPATQRQLSHAVARTSDRELGHMMQWSSEAQGECLEYRCHCNKERQILNVLHDKAELKIKTPPSSLLDLHKIERHAHSVHRSTFHITYYYILHILRLLSKSTLEGHIAENSICASIRHALACGLQNYQK